MAITIPLTLYQLGKKTYTIWVMPISKSAKKAQRVAESKTSRNRYRKDLLKDALKKADASSISLIDKAAKWGIIHPNKAARLKSQLSKTVETKPTEKKAAKPKAKATKKTKK